MLWWSKRQPFGRNDSLVQEACRPDSGMFACLQPTGLILSCFLRNIGPSKPFLHLPFSSSCHCCHLLQDFISWKTFSRFSLLPASLTHTGLPKSSQFWIRPPQKPPKLLNTHRVKHRPTQVHIILTWLSRPLLSSRTLYPSSMASKTFHPFSSSHGSALLIYALILHGRTILY